MNKTQTTGTILDDEETRDRLAAEERPVGSKDEPENQPGPDSAPESEGGQDPSPQRPGDDFFADEDGEAGQTDGSEGTESASSDGSNIYAEDATRSALPALLPEDGLQPWQPEPTSWRKRAATHAGAAVLGAAVAVGAIAATIGLTPKEKPVQTALATDLSQFRTAPPPPVNDALAPGLTAPPVGPGQDGLNGAPPTTGMVPGPTAPGAVTPGGPVTGGPNPTVTVPPGPPTMPQGSGRRPRFDGGTPLPSMRGNLLPPPTNMNLPPLTTLPTQPGVAVVPPMPPGIMPGRGNRMPSGIQPIPPSGNPVNTITRARPKGPTAPPVKEVNGKVTPAAPIGGGRAPERDESPDAAIARLRRTVDSNPNDALAQLQLEKQYRRKLIQAERVEEMEQYRDLADRARDKARNLLSGDGGRTAAPKPPAPKPAATAKPPAAGEGEKTQPAPASETKPASEGEKPAVESGE